MITSMTQGFCRRGSRLSRYGEAVNSHDLLKAAGIILMIVDHVGLYLLDDNLWFRVVGRAAAPLFFFLVGYSKHHRFRLSIFVYGLLLTLLSYLLYGDYFLNILLNFVIMKAVFERFDFHDVKRQRCVLLFLLLFVGVFVSERYLEYGSFGLLFGIAGRLYADKSKNANAWLVATVVGYFAVESLLFRLIFSIAYETLFVMLALALLYVFSSYRMRVWRLKRWFRPIILVLSRYSLEIYFFHLAALRLITFYR